MTGNARLKFKARNNIEILSGDYYPDSGGYIDLGIDENLVLNSCPPPPNNKLSQVKDDKEKKHKNEFEIIPTLVNKNVTISNRNEISGKMSIIKVYDFYGLEVYKKENITSNKIDIDLSQLNEGIYILKIFNFNRETLHTQKIIKK